MTSLYFVTLREPFQGKLVEGKKCIQIHTCYQLQAEVRKENYTDRMHLDLTSVDLNCELDLIYEEVILE